LEILQGYKGKFAIQSFNPYSLEYFKINAPGIMRGQLSCFFKESDLAWYKKYVLKRMLLSKKAKPDFVAYHFGDLPNPYCKKAGVPILAWTIRSEADYEQAKPYCDNIIFEGFAPKSV